VSECIRCGLCCTVCDMFLDELTPANQAKAIDKLRWLNLHRCDTQLRTLASGAKVTVLRIPLTCTALDQDPDGKYKCKNYENRPQLCRDFNCGREKKAGSYTGMPETKQAEHPAPEANRS
jgi:Fe-S-cluster containining protein